MVRIKRERTASCNKFGTPIFETPGNHRTQYLHTHEYMVQKSSDPEIAL